MPSESEPSEPRFSVNPDLHGSDNRIRPLITFGRYVNEKITNQKALISTGAFALPGKHDDTKTDLFIRTHTVFWCTDFNRSLLDFFKHVDWQVILMSLYDSLDVIIRPTGVLLPTYFLSIFC